MVLGGKPSLKLEMTERFRNFSILQAEEIMSLSTKEEHYGSTIEKEKLYLLDGKEHLQFKKTYISIVMAQILQLLRNLLWRLLLIASKETTLTLVSMSFTDGALVGLKFNPKSADLLIQSFLTKV